MRVLIAEDEYDMNKILCIYLKNEGYNIESVFDGKSALNILFEKSFDLVILDWMMPYIDGITICKKVRSYKIPIKIIMLTAKSETDNEFIGLSCGADDYIKKPFEPKVLLLRIKKLFHMENILSCGDISLNQETQIVKNMDVEIKLSKKEYELLLTLLLNQGMIWSREKLLDQVWGMDYIGEERTVDTHIRRLRSKIGQNYIITHIGLGYSMGKQNE